MSTPPTDDGRTMFERMLAGDLYMADNPQIEAAALESARLQDRYNATGAEECDLRRTLLEQLLGSIGEGTVIRPPFRCDYGPYLHVGARCFANFGLVALDVAPITLRPKLAMWSCTHRSASAWSSMPWLPLASGIEGWVKKPKRPRR